MVGDERQHLSESNDCVLFRQLSNTSRPAKTTSWPTAQLVDSFVIGVCVSEGNQLHRGGGLG